MGQPASEERLEFINLGVDCGNGRMWHICKHCNKAYRDSEGTDGVHTLSEPSRIKGRIENFKTHLKRCKYFVAYVQSCNTSDSAPSTSACTNRESTSASLKRGRLDDGDVVSQQSSKRQRLINDYFEGISEEEERKRLGQYVLEFQADHNLPDSFVERKSTIRLLRHAHKMKTDELQLPKRKTLGGPILDEYAVISEGSDSSALRECQTKTQGRVNFLSDVWQNIARAHLLGCQLLLYGCILIYGLFATGSRHDGVAIAQQMEAALIKMKSEGWNVGAVVTDNAGQCGRARRILSPRWPEIAFLICFAHDLNNLVKAVLKSDFAEVTKQASDAVNTLNGSSAKWLVEAHECMKDTYGYTLNLKQLCETRWNSMHGCFASLLRVRSGLEMLELKFRDVDDFPDALQVFGKRSFWDTLIDAEEVVRPLAYASLKLQRDENTMADVVACYLDIFAGFSRRPYGSQNLIKEVEKRWRQCEQPLMLLALFLHPGHRQAAKKLLDLTPLTTTSSLCRIGMYYFKRFNVGEEDSGLYEDLHTWIKGEDDTVLPFASFSSIHSYWKCMGSEMPRSKLPALALTILSIAVNTATCERYFSELALIHTAKRNRMSPEKARKLSLVRKRVREYDRDNSKDVQAKKLTDPTERTRLRDRDERFESIAADELDSEEDDAVGADNALEFWQNVLCELEGDDDPPVALGSGINDDDRHLQDNAGDTTEEDQERFAAKLEKIKRQSLEPIPERDQRPFPTYNDRTFPQEKHLPGLRGQKISLAELSSVPNSSSSRPVWHFASPQPFQRGRR